MSTAGRQVLMVDDNPGDILLLRSALNEAAPGVDLEAVESGPDALAHLRHLATGAAGSPPELIILDLNLPQVHGFELLEFIKGEPTLKDISTVVLTSSSAPHDRDRSYALGADEFFVKPGRFEGFLTLASRLVAHLESV